MRPATLSLILLVVLLAVAASAPSAMASFTCNNGDATTTCVITFTATAADPSRSGSTGFSLTFNSGISTVVCNDLTISSDLTNNNVDVIVATARNVSFSDCRFTEFGLDTRCRVAAIANTPDSTWRVTLLSSTPVIANSYNVEVTFGELTIQITSCPDTTLNGNLSIASGTRVRTTRYTRANGILTATDSSVAVSASGNIARRSGRSANMLLNVSLHAVNDRSLLSPSVS